MASERYRHQPEFATLSRAMFSLVSMEVAMHPMTETSAGPSELVGSPVSTATRVRGGLLMVLGTLLAIGMAVLLFNLLPTMLNPGVPVAGTTFSGSVALGQTVIAVLSWVALLGLSFAVGGVFLLRQGRYPRGYAVVMGLMIAVTVLGALRLNSLLS